MAVESTLIDPGGSLNVPENFRGHRQEETTMSEMLETWKKPGNLSFQEWMETRVARFKGRKYDWNALKFQADFDPKYRRAQMRYIGTGATGVKADTNTIPAENFTFSTMVLPSKCE